MKLDAAEMSLAQEIRVSVPYIAGSAVKLVSPDPTYSLVRLCFSPLHRGERSEARAG